MPRDIYRPRLRILLDPIYISAVNLSGSSTYRRFSILTKELVDRGHYVYWCIPDQDNYVPSEIEDHPNVGIIRTKYLQDQFVTDGLITDDFFNYFNRVGGKYHIDVMCTCRNSLAAYYKRILSPARFHDAKGDFTDKGYGLPVLIVEDFVQNRKEQFVSEAYWLMQMLGYLASDHTIFASDHNVSSVAKEMMDYFTIKKVREFTEEKATVLPVGISCSELDTIYDKKRWKVEPGFQVVSIGRIFGPTYLEYLPWFDYIFKSGISDARLTISLSGALSGPMRHKLKKIGFDLANIGKQFRVLQNNSRANYIRQLRSYHAFICPMSHIDHPAGLFEAMYMGLPGVLPVSDYQQTFFSDYPFVIEPKDKAGLVGNLNWIKENRKEAREMVAPWRDIIREKYNAETNVKILADMIEESARSNINRYKTSKAVIKFAKELKGESYTWGDVLAYLRNSGRIGVSIGNMRVRSTFTYSHGAIHHTMGMAGFVDVCDGPEERFVRKDIFKKRYGDGKSKA